MFQTPHVQVIVTARFLVVVAGSFFACPATGGETLEVETTQAHGPQRPSQVPLLDGLNAGTNSPCGPVCRAPNEDDYKPALGDSFTRHNGQMANNYILTSGSWWLRVGDRPGMSMEVRSGKGAYAQPGILPDLGISGSFQPDVTVGGQTKRLDKFDSIDVVLSPGSVMWTCSDMSLGASVKLVFALYKRSLV